LPGFSEGVFRGSSRLTSRSIWEAAFTKILRSWCFEEYREIQDEEFICGNMSFQTSEAELRELFAPFGQVTAACTWQWTGKPWRARGFAFIEMPNDAEAAAAMTALDGKEVGDAI